MARYANDRVDAVRVIVRKHIFGDEVPHNFVLLPGESCEIMHGTYVVEDRDYRELTQREFDVLSAKHGRDYNQVIAEARAANPLPVAPEGEPATLTAEQNAAISGAPLGGLTGTLAEGAASEQVPPQPPVAPADAGSAGDGVVVSGDTAVAEVGSDVVIANPDQLTGTDQPLGKQGADAERPDAQLQSFERELTADVDQVNGEKPVDARNQVADAAAVIPPAGDDVAAAVEAVQPEGAADVPAASDGAAVETMIAEGSPVFADAGGDPQPEAIEVMLMSDPTGRDAPLPDEPVAEEPPLDEPSQEPEVETPELSPTPA